MHEHSFAKTVLAFVVGGSHTSVVSTADLSQAENRAIESDDSFFNAWLAKPSQLQDAGQSPSPSKSPLAPKHQPSRPLQSASLKTSRSLSRTLSSEATDSGDKAAGSEKKLLSVTSSEQSAVVKSDQKEVGYSQLQPISVSVSDDRQARPENRNVAGLLISTNTDDTARISSSEHSEIKFDANVAPDKRSFSDVRKTDLSETSVTLFVSNSNEAGTDGSVDDHRVILAADSKFDTSTSSGHFNSQLSSSILSPEPDELLGIDGDIQPEGGWNDMAESDMWLSSTVDLPETESADISVESEATKAADQPDSSDVDFHCDKPTGLVGIVDGGSQNSDINEVPTNIPKDTSSVLSADADIKVVKEIASLDGSVKEASSLEGSLEASADELSESNKTVVAEDSDVYGDDTDVDEMQMSGSGSARSVVQQEHSTSVLSSSAGSSETVGKECDLSSGTAATSQLEQSSSARGDDSSEAGETSPPSSSSCVKNLLEEAMADNSVRDGTGLAEPSRIESGGNSGHTSADEIDTTTSSDIEIISHTSSMNGRATSTHGSRPVDISPRHNVWNSRTQYNAVSGQHRRSDSGSSAQSLQSRTEDDFASPDADHGRDYLSRSTRDSRRHFAKSDPGW